MQSNRRHTVLIIEDNAINRDVLEWILKKDYNLFLAENGEKGLALLREHDKEIDVVLLDIEMPVMNGYEVLEAKAKEALIRDIPVIITTASDGRGEEIHCLELGATDFVRKPYDPVVVRLRINNIISLRESTEANRQKAIFIQNISHEVRTPMNAILGFSQLISSMDGCMDDKERSVYLDFIKSNSLMLMGMIDNMIVLSDLDGGSFSVAKAQVALNDLCRTAMSEVEYCFPKGVNVYFTSDVDDTVMITTDAKRLQLALVNYITNACKFTHDGEIHIHCALDAEGGVVKISVTDTGVGVSTDKADFVFERFTKIDEFVPGMGLGLSISRKIARSLEGRAYLDTTYEGGARFVIEVPL